MASNSLWRPRRPTMVIFDLNSTFLSFYKFRIFQFSTEIYGAHQFWETPLVLKGLSLLCQRVQLDDEENQYWFTGLKSQRLARKGLKVEKLRKNPFHWNSVLVKVLKTKVCLKYLLVQSSFGGFSEGLLLRKTKFFVANVILQVSLLTPLLKGYWHWVIGWFLLRAAQRT